MGNDDFYICPLCNRKHQKDKMDWHHLLPAVGDSERDKPRIYICKTCHTVIHYCHNNYDLRAFYNTLEKIKVSYSVMVMLNLYKNKTDNCIFPIKVLKRRMKQVA